VTEGVFKSVSQVCPRKSKQSNKKADRDRKADTTDLQPQYEERMYAVYAFMPDSVVILGKLLPVCTYAFGECHVTKLDCYCAISSIMCDALVIV